MRFSPSLVVGIGLLACAIDHADAAFSASAIGSQLAQRGDTVSCILGETGHTRLCIKRYNSQRDVPNGQTVKVLSLTNIAVDPSERRKGHARRAMLALHRYGRDEKCAFIVENVVSDAMHTIIEELNGEPLWGSRKGARGCHYWLPPTMSTSWQDMAI